jgi:hypothetical protein
MEESCTANARDHACTSKPNEPEEVIDRATHREKSGAPVTVHGRVLARRFLQVVDSAVSSARALSQDRGNKK